MILFAGIPTEPPVALAIESAERRGVAYLVLNQRRWSFCDLQVEMRGGELSGQLWLDEKLWPLAELTGIYARTVEPNTLPELQPRGRTMPDPRQLARSSFLHEVFNDWLELAPGRVINRPSAMASNVSKPFQAQLIVAQGFATPPTLVTNDPEKVRDFHARHGHIVYKSISSVRSIVEEWRPSRQGDLERVRLLPTQFQALIPGTNIRVHVVGAAVFATAIASGAVDYRYAAREGHDTKLEATTLPRDVEDACRKLTARLGLAFAGIDLKRTPDGEWYCFEVNTSPGYSYFEEQTGQPIADELVTYLAGLVSECARVAGEGGMVQVIENRADLDGRVLAIRDDASRPGHKLATFEIQAVRPVENYPNLLAEAAGTRLDLVIPDVAAHSLKVGSAVRCRARRTGPSTVFAESCSRTGQ